MKNEKNKRRSYLKIPASVELGRAPIRVYGYDTSEKFVCCLKINAAGVTVLSGTKGGKQLYTGNWEKLVQKLTDEK
jgi:hypothetical protein